MKRKDRTSLGVVLGMLSLVAMMAATKAVQASPPGGPPRHPAAALTSAGSFNPDKPHVPGEILVKLVDRPSRAAIGRAASKVNARPVKSFPSIGVELWKLGRDMPVGRAISQLARAEFRGAIAYAEPNWISSLHELSNDPQLPQLWGLHNIGQTGGTDDADIDAPEAWGVTTGSAEVVIAVLDSGIDYLHEDLAGNIWVNTFDADGDGTDDDGNGFIDDVRGWDFVNDDNDPLDDHGHGTHTSGTIGAVGNNGIGVSGVNHLVKIMPLKVCSAGGYCTTDDQIDALLYAASFEDQLGNKLVRITSNSYGGGRRSKTLQGAIEQSGALFVASAGNSRSSRKQYPAGYDLDDIISVAATDHDDEMASFSNYGVSWVDLAAPGVDVLSTVPNDQYDLGSGTSMSAPHVAGVAGLVLAQFPSMTNAEIKAQILETVDPLASLVDRVMTGGRLNAAGAVGASGGPPDAIAPGVVILSVDPLLPPTHDTVTLNWTAPGDDGSAGTAFLYDVRYAPSAILSDTDFDTATEVQGEPSPQIAGTPETFLVSDLSPETTYYFALKTSDAAGNVSDLSNSPSATTGPAPPTAWMISTVGEGGTYLGLDFDASGTPAVAYANYPNSEILFARWNGTGWDKETVDSREYAGVDLAYDSFGQPTVTYGWGKLYANEQASPGDWDRTTVSPGSRNDVTSVRLDPSGNLGVAYRARTGLGFARRIGGTWIKETVDSGAAARYVALAYDQSGNPAIAYSDDPDGDGWLSALKLARFDGAAWTTEIVAEGPTGYGVPSAIAFAPGSDVPTLMHESARLLEWNGAQWMEQQLDSNGGSGSIIFAADGTLYTAWEADSQIKMGTRAPGATEWIIDVVDSGPAGAFHLPLRLSPDEGEIYLAYDGENDVRVAWRMITP